MKISISLVNDFKIEDFYEVDKTLFSFLHIVAIEFNCSICFLWLSYAVKVLAYKYFSRLENFFAHGRHQRILFENKYVRL